MVDVKKDGVETLFVFKDTHNTIVNSIRRTIIDDVPTFAIEEVEIVQNDSPLYDEVIAHRLGLIPLKTDLKSYNFKSECKCGGVGCALCEVSMTFKGDEEGYVYSGNIKSNDPKIVPVDDKIPVTKLLPNRNVEMNLKAVLGTGREHAKWAPGHAYMRENGKNVELVLESFGQLDAKETYNKAIDILKDKIDELEAQL